MNKTINLFCLPFAGGHKYSYRDYQENAPANIKVIPLEYPGRVGRIQEAPIHDIRLLTDYVYQQIAGRVHEHDYAIYGHSMGGLIAYLLTQKIIENKLKPPVHVFITGTSGPSANSRFEVIRHKLPKDEFLQEMKELDGIPDAILENEDLLAFFEPILRADFEACETYKHIESAPLDVPMSVITGTEEDMTEEDIHLWQNESTYKIDFKQLPGKHFFIFHYPMEIMEIISNTLTTNLKKLKYD